MGQLFLGNPPLVPNAAQVRCEKLTQIHCASQPACGLLTHGFKTEFVGCKWMGGPYA
ncbi:hypothetical protein J2R96_001397 [Bradyrhizobium elkanii]|nr:hypothetical protein [Bradyrhizobium elkanii]